MAKKLKQTKDASITIRLPSDEKAYFETLAQEYDISLSDFARSRMRSTSSSLADVSLALSELRDLKRTITRSGSAMYQMYRDKQLSEEDKNSYAAAIRDVNVTLGKLGGALGL